MGLDMAIHVKSNNKQEFEEVAYFRKFNALHGYFEERYEEEDILDGVEIHPYIIEDLYLRTDKIMNSYGSKRDEIAEENLPVTPGFFYGSYEYDDYYYHNLSLLHVHLTYLKKLVDTHEIYYSASW